MSPFSQLGSVLGHNNIDHQFNSALGYLDELDRHFSHRHRLMNCFIPRFDLEEDAKSYYLYGDLPGACAENIAIEAHGENTLVIFGRINRPHREGSSHPNRHSNNPDHNTNIPLQGTESKGVPQSENGNTEISVDASNARRPNPDVNGQPAPSSKYPDIYRRDTNAPPQHELNHIPVDVSDSGKPRHQSYSSSIVQHDSRADAVEKDTDSGSRSILSERLVGDFHRSFTLPFPISEEGVQASMESGVLFLLVPKAEGRANGRRIHIGKTATAGGTTY
jgi:HSP20 family molecular chaperone IbpA